MIFEKMEEITDKVSASEYLKEMNDRTFNGIDSVDIYNSDDIITYDVTDAETIFMLPENYVENKSMVDVYVDGVEQNDYSIEEKSFVNCVVLKTAISNAKIKIRCRNFKHGFLIFLENNLPMG